MYPMDGAKLIVCSSQLCCGVSAKTAAKILVYTSAPLAVLFIGYSLKNMKSGGGGMFPGISAYLGFMCLTETYRIYQLMKAQKLYTHPLFELARSETIETADESGVTRRLNHEERDDEVPRTNARAAREVQITEVRAPPTPLIPFSGGGLRLGSTNPQPSTSPLLERIERQAQHNQKTVRELEEEALASRQQPRGGRR